MICSYYDKVIKEFLDTRDDSENSENIVLVSINYNSKTKEHSCVIEKY